MTETIPPFLSGFVPEPEWCADNGGICRKTCQRYRNQPDGLPYLEWGGRIWIGPADQARAWLLRRVKHRNPPTKKRPSAA
jgi:hypothetical protein